MSGPPTEERKGWLDDRRNLDRLWYGVIALSILLFVADAFYHKHIVVPAEGWFGFYALYSLVAGLVLVLAARGLRRLLRRPEDYYDKTDG